jgi:hypothetical protein
MPGNFGDAGSVVRGLGAVAMRIISHFRGELRDEYTINVVFKPKRRFRSKVQG